jgi:hypothetical protein
MSGNASVGDRLMYNESGIQYQALGGMRHLKSGFASAIVVVTESKIASRGGFQYRNEVGWLD